MYSSSTEKLTIPKSRFYHAIARAGITKPPTRDTSQGGQVKPAVQRAVSPALLLTLLLTLPLPLFAQRMPADFVRADLAAQPAADWEAYLGLPSDLPSAADPPFVSLELANRPFVQIVIDPRIGEFANVYRAEEPAGPWVKIIDHFPTAAHTAVDYLAQITTNRNVYYRIAPVDAAETEGELSAASEIDLTATIQMRAAQVVAGNAYMFDKNNIIADAQLLNPSAMTVTDIQNFLTSRGSVLANLTFSSGSAAQIIFNACQTHGISPYVVLTTLHKEQSLIGSSTVNLQTRLNFAMGWGSPSSFSEQVYYGARQFRLYHENLAVYVDVKGVPWRVGQLQTVYDGTVTPTNPTTAGLFIYTPWIGQGGGGRTGVGGNYLFWDLWFNKFAFGSSGNDGATAPAAPSGLTASAMSPSSIEFSWTDNSSTETNFIVSRWNGSMWSQIASVGANVTRYTDSGLQPSTTYYYTVCAQNGAGTNCASTYASATTQGSNSTSAPAAPSGLTASAMSPSSIDFSWTDHSSTETNFIVSRWNGSMWSQIASVGANVTSYTDSGLQPSTTYYYTVCAQNSAGTNCATSYASATTQSSATAPGTPTGLTPNSVSVNGSPVWLSWSDVSSARSYEIEIWRWTGTSWAYIGIFFSGSSRFDFWPPVGAYYAWRVHTVAAGGVGPWSEWAIFYSVP